MATGMFSVNFTMEDCVTKLMELAQAGHIGNASLVSVIKERVRQVGKGYDSTHDDEHAHGEIAISAIAYIEAAHQEYLGLTDEELRVFWYFDGPMPNLKKDRREMLVKATAMLLAEIDRLDRVTGKAISHGG